MEITYSSNSEREIEKHVDAVTCVYNSEVVGLEPSIESKSGVVENGMQSDIVKTTHSQSQSLESHSIGIQTSEVRNVELGDDIMTRPALVTFLRRVTPIVLEALNEELKVDLTTSYDTEYDRDETVYIQSVDCLKEVFLANNSLSVLALSWNSTGNTLAVGLGLQDHKQCYGREGFIQLYKPERLVGEKWELYHSFSTDCCVTKLQFHPGVPFLLAYSVCEDEIYIQNVGEVPGRSRDGEIVRVPAKTSKIIRIDSYKCTNFRWLSSEQTEFYVESCVGVSEVRRNDVVLMVIDLQFDSNTFNLWKISTNLDHSEKILECHWKVNSDITCFDIDSCKGQSSTRDMMVLGHMSGDINIVRWADIVSLKNDFQNCNADYGLMDKHSCCVLAVRLCGSYISSLGADGEIRIHNIANKHADSYRMAKGAVIPNMFTDTHSNLVFATAKWSDRAGNPEVESINVGQEAVKILTIRLKYFERSNQRETEEDVNISTCLASNNIGNIMAVGENCGGVHIFCITKKK